MEPVAVRSLPIFGRWLLSQKNRLKRPFDPAELLSSRWTRDSLSFSPLRSSILFRFSLILFPVLESAPIEIGKTVYASRISLSLYFSSSIPLLYHCSLRYIKEATVGQRTYDDSTEKRLNWDIDLKLIVRSIKVSDRSESRDIHACPLCDRFVQKKFCWRFSSSSNIITFIIDVAY